MQLVRWRFSFFDASLYCFLYGCDRLFCVLGELFGVGLQIVGRLHRTRRGVFPACVPVAMTPSFLSGSPVHTRWAAAFASFLVLRPGRLHIALSTRTGACWVVSPLVPRVP